MKVASLVFVLLVGSFASAETNDQLVNRFVGTYKAQTTCVSVDGKAVIAGDKLAITRAENYGNLVLKIQNLSNNKEILALISLYSQDLGNRGKTTFKVKETVGSTTIETLDEPQDDETDGLIHREKLVLFSSVLQYHWDLNDYGVFSAVSCQFEKVSS
jgi:hypothetical protein